MAETDDPCRSRLGPTTPRLRWRLGRAVEIVGGNGRGDGRRRRRALTSREKGSSNRALPLFPPPAPSPCRPYLNLERPDRERLPRRRRRGRGTVVRSRHAVSYRLASIVDDPSVPVRGRCGQRRGHARRDGDGTRARLTRAAGGRTRLRGPRSATPAEPSPSCAARAAARASGRRPPARSSARSRGTRRRAGSRGCSAATA